jgi:hypothetical protein
VLCLRVNAHVDRLEDACGRFIAVANVEFECRERGGTRDEAEPESKEIERIEAEFLAIPKCRFSK